MMKPFMALLPSLLVGAAALAAASAPLPASASPQVLGLVSMNEPLTMICDEKGCRAELSAFCLQQVRDNPDPDAQYTPADGADLALIGTRADGSTVRLDAADYASFESARGYTSVDASIDATTMQSLGLVSVSIEVGKTVSLLPTQEADDPDPQTPEEVALATGTYRSKAVEFFDASGEQADAIRLTNVMINDLPEHGRGPTDSDGTVLAAALDNGIAETVDPGAVQRASDMFAICREKVDVTHHVDNMRECLSGSHDRMIINSNIQFWESLGGS
jgi:hypothetical protein